MRRTLGKWGALLLWLLPVGALAQVPPESGTYLQGVGSADLLTLGWGPAAPFLPAGLRGPSLRAGVLLPKMAVGGRAGFYTSGSLGAGYAGVSGLSLGAEVTPWLWTRGATRAYALGGLGLGTLLELYPGGATLVPTTSLDLGVGLQHFLTDKVALGAEVGLRNQLTWFPSNADLTHGLFVSLTGTWLDLWSTGTAARGKDDGKPPAGPQGPAIAQGETPQQHSTPGNTPASRNSRNRCTAWVTDGWFAPTQGVWQDDPSFKDRRNKQLSRKAGEEVEYEAEMWMVTGRDTVLYGVHHYEKWGEQVVVNSRDTIVLKGLSTCTRPVPVKMRFTLYSDAGTMRTLYVSPVLGQVPLEGPPSVEPVPWEVRLPVGQGLPPDKTFRFDMALKHRLEAMLERENGRRTSLRMEVETYATDIEGPRVHFVPVLLNEPEKRDEVVDRLRLLTDNLSKDTAENVPDLFPLRPMGLPVTVKSLRSFINLEVGSIWFEFRRIEAVVAALNDSLAASVFLDGAGRVVAVMPQADFDSIFQSKDAAGMTVGASFTPRPKGEAAQRQRAVSLSWKVMMVPSTSMWDTVAHELVHSLPEGWSSKGMKRECDMDYHNQKVPVAHGIRLNKWGQPVRELKQDKQALMGPEALIENTWITQCTYSHLLYTLAGGPPDPPVVLLRAFLGRKGQKAQGELRPMYQMMGYGDLQPGSGGPWAFVLRDEKGAELGRYPFTPRFDDPETGLKLSMTSAVYRVPMPPGLATVELVGPGGVLDKEKLSTQVPAVLVTSPAEGETVAPKNGKVRVAWQGEGQEGLPLLYSVLYSPDGGKSFVTQAFEQTEAEYEVTVDPKGTEHQVKVIVTDGTRSAEAVIPLQLAGK